MTVLHVVADIYREDAGPSYSVPRLVRELALTNRASLHALEPPPSRDPGVEAVYYRRSAWVTSLGFSRAMKRGLGARAREADIVHAHGLWMMPTIYASRSASASEARLVLSPRGMLEPWLLRWHRWRKAAFSVLFQEEALRRVDCFHATSQMEAQSIRGAGLDAPIAVIPIGVDLPPLERRPRSGRRILLYLGRLHPKKNVDGLLRVWGAISAAHPDWWLVIAGGGEDGYVRGLHRIAGELSRVEFAGESYGRDKAKLLSGASVLVLPSHSENFGIVVAEALSYGVPVVAGTGSPWDGLGSAGCGWWTAVDDQSLGQTLDEVLRLDETTLLGMGRDGREWVERAFSWKSVAERTEAVYHWLADGGPSPEFIV